MDDNNFLSKDFRLLFQLYLLSIMRVEQLVLDDALKCLQATEADLKSAKDKMIAFGFGSIGTPAKLYREILGTPISVQSIDSSKIPTVFEGSYSMVFRLPLWQDFDFIVNENRQGQAWDPGFRRPMSHSHIAQLESAADLKPWKFVKEEITYRFGNPENGDGWDYWEELYYFIPSNEDQPPEKYLLVFDYNLLQFFGKVT